MIALPSPAIRAAPALLAFTALAVVTLPEPASGQGTRADYERADSMPALVRDKVVRSGVEPRWLPGESRFWYRVDLGDGRREYVLLDAEAGTREPAFDHAAVAAALSAAAGIRAEPDRLSLDRLLFDPLRFEAEGRWWRFDEANGTLTEFRPPVEAEKPGRTERSGRRRGRGNDSSDGLRTAFIREGDIFLRDRDDGRETRLTTDGSREDGYRDDVSWSPNSKKVVALRRKRATERTVHLIESSPRDQLQPKLHSFGYAKPGDEIDRVAPHLFDLESGKAVPISDALFPNPWSIEDVHWAPDSSRFTFLYNERGHQVLRLVSVDARTGEATTVVEERSPTFVDYPHKRFARRLDETGELIWMSERSGWNHLYLNDLVTGAPKNPITRGDWLVRGVDHVDPDTRRIWFRAGGVRPGQDPYHVHHCRANFDGTGLVVLTEGDGTHDVSFSSDRRFFVDTYSRVDLPPVTELRREDGSLVLELERANWSDLLAAGWVPPERFTAKGRDGATDIYGVIHRPTTFDPAATYPVVEKIYAGPHGAFVPKRFSAWHGDAQSLAELGFVVVQIDGMGTNWRSKAFHDVCWKNLGDSGFPDRIVWLKAAAAAHSEMDLTRVGIYGGSAGGQSALRALLAHGDFYDAAAADCGCHDNRMDKIWWNELWMGYPIGPHYEEQSNVTQAHRLTGKLLLIVGELDRNVDPASTMQVVDALVRADKDFELLVIPGAGHGAAGSRYGTRRQRDFFVRHLLGVEPRAR